MENQTNNEPVVMNKWHARLKKWRNRGIILGVIYGLWWLFSPLLSVYDERFMTGVNLGEHKTMTDYYYVNIGGITYAKDKFYVLLNKPYLFKNHNGYIYSSKNLVNWGEEAQYNSIPGSSSSVSRNFSYNDYSINSIGHPFFKGSDDSNNYVPRQVDGNCYIIDFRNGFFSPSCNGSWKRYSYLSESENANLIFDKNEDSVLGICEYIKNRFSQNRVAELEKFLCLPTVPKQNDASYLVLTKIVKANHLDIVLTSSSTAYGDGKYVGIFYKNKQYYFIISADGIHYEIKPVPEELTSSLAIKLFN